MQSRAPRGPVEAEGALTRESTEELDVLGQHVDDAGVGRRPPRLVVSNVTEVEAFSWSTVMLGSLSRAV